MNYQPITRRGLLAGSALYGGLILTDGTQDLASGFGDKESSESSPTPASSAPSTRRLPDLAPARWIWYPSGRTLQSTFILFRREVDLAAKPRSAFGWIAADNRYRLEVNGQRLQFGPAPADPRWTEADPVDLTAVLREGRNVVWVPPCSSTARATAPAPWARRGSCSGLRSNMPMAARRRSSPTRAGGRCSAGPGSPGHYKRWYLRAPSGRVRRAALPSRLEHAGIHAHRGLAGRDAFAGIAQQARPGHDRL